MSSFNFYYVYYNTDLLITKIMSSNISFSSRSNTILYLQKTSSLSYPQTVDVPLSLELIGLDIIVSSKKVRFLSFVTIRLRFLGRNISRQVSLEFQARTAPSIAYSAGRIGANLAKTCFSPCSGKTMLSNWSPPESTTLIISPCPHAL